MDSLWELHGEELAYAEQYRVTDPAAFARARERVLADNLGFLRQWGRWTAGTLLLTAAALVWEARRGKRSASSGDRHAAHQARRGGAGEPSPEGG